MDIVRLQKIWNTTVYYVASFWLIVLFSALFGIFLNLAIPDVLIYFIAATVFALLVVSGLIVRDAKEGFVLKMLPYVAGIAVIAFLVALVMVAPAVEESMGEVVSLSYAIGVFSFVTLPVWLYFIGILLERCGR